MRVVFAHDHTFYEDSKGVFYSSGKLSYEVWLRYLKVFNEVIVVGRGQYVDESKITSLNVSSGPNVSFCTVPNINQISKDSLNNMRIAKQRILTALEKADCLIARLPSQVGSLAVKIARKLNIPYAIEMVGDPWDAYWYYGNWKGKILAPFFSYKTKRILKNSKHVLYVTREYLQKRYPTAGFTEVCSNVEIKEPPNTVLENKIAKIRAKTDGVTVGLIGSLNANYKGIDTALNALNLVKSELPNFKFRILGDGDQTRWKQMSKDLNLDSHVIFDGVLPGGSAVEGWLDDIDIYIQPSLTEGLPRALVEAMSRACPALGSTVGGIPELLDSTECLHAPKDHKELAKLILKSLDKDWQVKQAEKNFIHAKDYYREALEMRRSSFWEQFYNYCKTY